MSVTSIVLFAIWVVFLIVFNVVLNYLIYRMQCKKRQRQKLVMVK